MKKVIYCYTENNPVINRSRGVHSLRAQEHYLTPSMCENTEI